MKTTTYLFSSIVLLALVLASSMQAQATLQNLGTDSLGNRLIYDTDFDITWYDFTNTSANWQAQVDWALGLSVTFGSNVYDDWRLPTALNQNGSGPCGGYNCTGSEMGHLYYTELGNLSGGPLTNTGDFQHLLSGTYWSGTEYAGNTVFAWDLYTNGGYQGTISKTNPFSAVAVRPGLAVVPEPVSSALFIVGAATLGVRRLRNKFRK